jgi:hypothetical protein
VSRGQHEPVEATAELDQAEVEPVVSPDLDEVRVLVEHVGVAEAYIAEERHVQAGVAAERNRQRVERPTSQRGEVARGRVGREIIRPVRCGESYEQIAVDVNDAARGNRAAAGEAQGVRPDRDVDVRQEDAREKLWLRWWDEVEAHARVVKAAVLQPEAGIRRWLRRVQADRAPRDEQVRSPFPEILTLKESESEVLDEHRAKPRVEWAQTRAVELDAFSLSLVRYTSPWADVFGSNENGGGSVR